MVGGKFYGLFGRINVLYGYMRIINFDSPKRFPSKWTESENLIVVIVDGIVYLTAEHTFCIMANKCSDIRILKRDGGN